jgi:hypothetical protein
MRFAYRFFLATALAAFAGFLVSSVARADFTGFGDFSEFTVNVNDSGSAPTVSNGTIHLTNGNNDYRSIFYDTPQNISQFTASFTYQAIGPSYTCGACFVLENSTAGASAVGNGYLGYGGITGKSLGVTLETSGNLTGYYTNATFGGGSQSTSPVNLVSGDPINVTLTYNGSLLDESLLDTKTSASYSTSYLVLTKFPTVLGGSTAYVGLTANTTGTIDQYFSNFQFSAIPEPSTFALLGVGAVSLLGYGWRRRRLAS